MTVSLSDFHLSRSGFRGRGETNKALPLVGFNTYSENIIVTRSLIGTLVLPSAGIEANINGPDLSTGPPGGAPISAHDNNEKRLKAKNERIQICRQMRHTIE